jgi:hypothetical protein
VENVGDELHEKVDQAGREMEYKRGRSDEMRRNDDFGQ